MSKNISELSGRKGLQENLFEELGILAKSEGTPNKQDLEKLADEFLIGKANVYGSASFYDFTREANKGKKIYICNGSSCMTAGTQDKVHEKIEKHFAANEIGEMCCLGRCHENSSFYYDGKNYSGDAIEQIEQITKGEAKPTDEYHVESLGTPVLTEEFPGIDEFYKILADCLKKTPMELLAELKTSGVRGRGGAGFPMSFKLESCKNTPSNTKFVVCNADEGDPGAYSDRYLLEQRPHAVLLGMIITGYIIGSATGVLYIRGEYPESIDIIEDELGKLLEKNLIGENILGSGFSYNFKVIRAQGAYICGEETALLSSIEGQRPEVRVRPPYPAQQGLFNKPTVVNNVETLACVPWIMREGGEKFAAIGRGKSTGTKLVSLDGFFNRPGIYEVDMGTPLSVVVNDLGQGFNAEIKALHIGGPLGGMVPVSKINELTVDFESFNQTGFLLGHASIVCLPNSFPMIQYLEHLFEFTAHESCGKCFPCRLGSTRGQELLNKARTSDYKIDKTLLTDLIETMEIGSLCALGGGVPLPIRNALMYFDDELKPYFK
ncbi:MAG: NADH-ubiquinone oxidoreductase-F iron-sulfur binding region domain-containing protein [Bacteroidota bacterium]|nr:NADH-ubiquinone oxidoreductase-F iron-sulfur binding region domain-containing protein [Bacteroidota bacterium]